MDPAGDERRSQDEMQQTEAEMRSEMHKDGDSLVKSVRSERDAKPESEMHGPGKTENSPNVDKTGVRE